MLCFRNNDSKLRCRMLLDNDFIPELTKRFDFIIAPGAGIVKNRDYRSDQMIHRG